MRKLIVICGLAALFTLPVTGCSENCFDRVLRDGTVLHECNSY